MEDYNINQVIELRDNQKLQWKDIEAIVGVSFETLRKQYVKAKKGISSVNPNNYQNQKLRGLKRKYEYIMKRGGKCECCGYNENLAALEFHHINSEDKEFQVDIRAFSNINLNDLEKELDKCKLLCANCHRKIHNPELLMLNIENLLQEASDKKSFNNKESHRRQSVCPICGNTFNYANGKIYCSKECRWKAKNYPFIEEINEQYKNLGSWQKVANYFNLTRKIIQDIRAKNS